MSVTSVKFLIEALLCRVSKPPFFFRGDGGGTSTRPTHIIRKNTGDDVTIMALFAISDCDVAVAKNTAHRVAPNLTALHRAKREPAIIGVGGSTYK